MKQRLTSLPQGLVATGLPLALLTISSFSGHRAVADEPVASPTAAAPVSSPEPTLLSTTTPIPVVQEAASPTVGETSAPTPTALPVPTVHVQVPATPTVLAREPSPTSIPTVTKTQTPVSRPTPPPVAPPTPVASQPEPTQTAPYIPPPSPSQLRASARLRWGTDVPLTVRRWAFLIVPAARKYGLDPALVAAVMTLESGGDPRAWSGADARGLMQVLHGPWDPSENVDLGVSMLASYLHEFHDLTLALAAYNAGPNAVIHYGGVPPYRETQDYVVIVSYLYDLYRHHHISYHQRRAYQKSIKDLQHFAQDRQKVKRLKHILPKLQAVQLPVHHHTGLFATHDPFWPVANQPDPLQQVSPDLSEG